MKGLSQRFSLVVLAIFFVVAGANHFLNPKPYLAMMPAFLPWPAQLVGISGWAEIAGGLGILLPRTRRLAGWGLIALLVAIYPANINVAINGWEGVSISRWLLWARLPLQFILIWWVYRTCLPPTSPRRPD